MKKRKFSKWTLSFGALGAVIGTMIGQIGDFSLSAVLGALSGALLIVIINIMYVKKKSDETPEFDERTMKNMRTFYFYAAMTFLAFIFVASGILLALDISSISVLLLFLVSFGYFVISGIVALIISKK